MPQPVLVIIRGNSGSGKTTTAREVRRRYGRGCALIEQDYLRRIVLREHDGSDFDPVAPAFITATARTALEHGYHVVLEGIMHAARYATVLRRLIGDHPGPSAVFYLDVSFAESVRRHRGRAEAANFTPEQMREWYAGRDVLGVPGERVIPESAAFEQTVTTVLETSGLLHACARTPCPTRCRHCDVSRDGRRGADRSAGAP